VGGKGTPPPPSATPDCTASKDGTTSTCKEKDDSVQLVDLIEVYKYQGKWKDHLRGARKQFINLDEKVDAANDHPEFGRAVWLKARLQWVSGDPARSLAGKEVYWYSNEDPANNAALTKKQKGSFDSAGGAKDKKKSTVDKDGWTKPIPFYLSLYGGDKFDIYATIDAGYKGGLKAGSYEVWRKFWFQVSEMTDRTALGTSYIVPPGVVTALVDGYDKAKIEMSEQGSRGTIPHQGNTPTSAIDKLGKTHFVKDDTVPFKCHLMTCDYAGQTTKSMKATTKMIANTWESPDWYLLWPHDGARSWKVEAKYKDGKAWKDIPDVNLNPLPDAGQPGYQKVEVDFSALGSPVTPSAADPVDIKLKLKCTDTKSLALGWGGGRAHILLCLGVLGDITPPADRDPTLNSTAVHETGHALGLVNMPPTKAGGHNSFETKDKKHKKHCSQPAGNCTMFWQVTAPYPTTFHSIGGSGCNEHLRTQDFSRSVMAPLWK
jgi:hypothetical protein